MVFQDPMTSQIPVLSYGRFNALVSLEEEFYKLHSIDLAYAPESDLEQALTAI